ncbi:hypothetical protein DFJ73DRAFT_913549 [Zopfochytrium polystomum]|nr:hypothetical protein DFJ73DRAFT_913549 [Zopfochytrium polystomum]
MLADEDAAATKVRGGRSRRPSRSSLANIFPVDDSERRNRHDRDSFSSTSSSDFQTSSLPQPPNNLPRTQSPADSSTSTSNDLTIASSPSGEQQQQQFEDGIPSPPTTSLRPSLSLSVPSQPRQRPGHRRFASSSALSSMIASVEEEPVLQGFGDSHLTSSDLGKTHRRNRSFARNRMSVLDPTASDGVTEPDAAFSSSPTETFLGARLSRSMSQKSSKSARSAMSSLSRERSIVDFDDMDEEQLERRIKILETRLVEAGQVKEDLESEVETVRKKLQEAAAKLHAFQNLDAETMANLQDAEETAATLAKHVHKLEKANSELEQRVIRSEQNIEAARSALKFAQERESALFAQMAAARNAKAAAEVAVKEISGALDSEQKARKAAELQASLYSARVRSLEKQLQVERARSKSPLPREPSAFLTPLSIPVPAPNTYTYDNNAQLSPGPPLSPFEVSGQPSPSLLPMDPQRSLSFDFRSEIAAFSMSGSPAPPSPTSSELSFTPSLTTDEAIAAVTVPSPASSSSSSSTAATSRSPDKTSRSPPPPRTTSLRRFTKKLPPRTTSTSPASTASSAKERSFQRMVEEWAARDGEEPRVWKGAKPAGARRPSAIHEAAPGVSGFVGFLGWVIGIDGALEAAKGSGGGVRASSGVHVR